MTANTDEYRCGLCDKELPGGGICRRCYIAIERAAEDAAQLWHCLKTNLYYCPNREQHKKIIAELSKRITREMLLLKELSSKLRHKDIAFRRSFCFYRLVHVLKVPYPSIQVLLNTTLLAGRYLIGRVSREAGETWGFMCLTDKKCPWKRFLKPVAVMRI